MMSELRTDIHTLSLYLYCRLLCFSHPVCVAVTTAKGFKVPTDFWMGLVFG